MFNCTTLFSTLSPLPHPIPIRLGDGKIVTSTHEGFVPIGNLTVQALYVPTFRVCLLSVSCLDLSGLRAAFANRLCTIYQIQNHRPILTRHLENGIYVHKISLQSNAFAATESTGSGCDTWHRRLGHISYDYIKTLFSNKQQPSSPCNVCILSKQTRAAHRKTPADRAIRPFQLIHSDSCTITTPSLSGSRYYLLFVDDFTRWTFVYFLNQKIWQPVHRHSMR